MKKATEDTLLALADHLPAEAAEALLELATGGKPRVSAPAVVTASPFDHPDAQRRFRERAKEGVLPQEFGVFVRFPRLSWTARGLPSRQRA